jgi:hypothetical protein
MRHSLPATATTLRPLGALAVLFWLAACSNTTATHGTTASVMPRDTGASYEETTYEEAVDDNDDDTFEVASSADEEELSKQRGGFIFAGGLKIDFGLATTTAINGIIQSSLNLNTSNLNGALPKSLQDLVTAPTVQVTQTTSTTPQVPVTTPSNTPSSTPLTTASTTPPPANNTPSVVPNTYTTSTNTTPPVTVNTVTTGANATTVFNSSVLTFIQNNSNNALIQNQNVINLTVSNFAQFRNEAALANSVSSLVRALH